MVYINWDKAKNFTILLLVVLNAFLGVLLYLNGGRYRLTGEQIKTVQGMLSQNGMTLNTNVIKTFRPLPTLTLSRYTYDTDIVIPALFDDSANVKRTTEYNRTIFRNDNERLTIQNEMLSYEKNITPTQPQKPVTRSAALAACTKKIKQLGKDFAEFKLDYVHESNNLFVMYFLEAYGRNTIYSNYMRVVVIDGAVSRMDIMRFTPESIGDKRIPVCSAAEALFSFAQYTRNTSPVVIDRIDLVYYLEDMYPKDNISIKATPFYRIYTSLNSTPYLINAFTNTVISGGI